MEGKTYKDKGRNQWNLKWTKREKSIKSKAGYLKRLTQLANFFS